MPINIYIYIYIYIIPAKRYIGSNITVRNLLAGTLEQDALSVAPSK